MTTAVEVPVTSFPIPLVQQLPLTMGLTLPEELTSYVFNEDLGEYGDFRIHIGEKLTFWFIR